MLRERMSVNRWFHSTVQELLAETCRDRPEKTAMVFEEERIPYGELQQQVNRLSQALMDLGVGPGDHVITLPTVSPQFAYVYFAALQVGALINPLNLLWGEIMDRYQPTSTVGFDAHYQALRMVQQSTVHRFSITKALGAITPQTYDMIEQELCEDRDVNIVMLYAQTENGPAVSFGEPDCMTRELKRSTNGRPLPGVAVVIKDIATGERLPSEEQGEICYRSPFMFSGYYKQEEETNKVFDEEGYLHSGDYGTFKDGYICFLGRLGGVVKSGGENVSTTYVSSLLLEIFSDDFEDILTFGVPDPYWGSKIVSLVRLKSGKKLVETKEIRSRCKGKMAEYEIPKDILEWEGPWPMTVVGKMDFKALEKALEERLAGR